MSEQAQRTLQTFSARELQAANIPDLCWTVDDLLPEGLAVLVSPPKFGKSWMSLQLSVAVATGKEFLNCPTHKGSVLYLALEDSKRRLQDRLAYFVGEGEEAPDNLYFATSAGQIGLGLEDEIRAFIEAHPGTALIIIDVLARVRPATSRKENPYYQDYSVMGGLKGIADRYKVAILIIHHTRKMTDSGDYVNSISGTNGISGSCDTIFTIERENRTDPTSILNVTGRDVQPQEIAIRRDPDNQHWYRTKPKVHTTDPDERRILQLMEMYPEGWKGTIVELLRITGGVTGDERSAATGFGRHLSKLQNKLRQQGIVYDKLKSSNGRLVRFYYAYQVENKEAAMHGGGETQESNLS